MVAVPTVRTWKDAPDPESIPTYKEFGESLFDVVNFLLNPPMVHLIQRSPAQNLPNITWTPILFDSEFMDTEGMHNATVQGTRVTPKTPGWYRGWIGTSWNAHASGGLGKRHMMPRKNGDFALGNPQRRDIRPQGVENLVVKGERFFMSFNGTTDYVELMSWQNSGATLTTAVSGSDEPRSELFLRWWRPL